MLHTQFILRVVTIELFFVASIIYTQSVQLKIPHQKPVFQMTDSLQYAEQQSNYYCMHGNTICDACYLPCGLQNMPLLVPQQCSINDSNIFLNFDTNYDGKKEINFVFTTFGSNSSHIAHNCGLRTFQASKNTSLLVPSIILNIIGNYDGQSNNITVLQNVTFQFLGIDVIKINGFHFFDSQGPVLYLQSVKLATISNVQFSNIISETNGSSVQISGSSQITLQNCFLSNCSAFAGGSIYITQAAAVTIINCNFQNNSALAAGGAIYLEKNAKLNCINCLFEGNFVLDNPQNISFGGAICAVQKVEITALQGTRFVKNTARMGGAIHLQSNSGVSQCSNSVFEQNIAGIYGGAISILQESYLINFVEILFDRNKVIQCYVYAQGYQNRCISNDFENGGGAISALDSSQINFFISCSFVQQFSINAGGAILLYQKSKFINSPNCLFQSNQADRTGGAIYLRKGSVYSNASNCIFKDNRSYYRGGGIHVRGKSRYTNAPNCLFQNNQANEGGAIFFKAQCSYRNAPNCTFISNQALGGGAIFLSLFSVYTKSDNCLFWQNHAVSGGAIQIFGQSSYAFCNNITFFNNTSVENGGAILLDATGILFNLKGVTFDSNQAQNQFGGGLYIGNWSFFIYNSDILFINNFAYFGGAGVNICNYSTIYSNKNMQFINNTAVNFGGGIVIGQYSRVIFNTIYFEGNSANIGGALCIFQYKGYLQFPLHKMVFKHNKATQYGGAIAISVNAGLLIRIVQCEIIQNTAEVYGGGLYSDATISMVVENTSFINNTSVQNGGAVALKQVYNLKRDQKILSVLFKNTQFTGNIARQGTGGALYFQCPLSPTDLTITNCQFTANIAFAGAGAVMINSANYQFITNNTFTKNIASQGSGAAVSTHIRGQTSYYQRKEKVFIMESEYPIEQIYIFNNIEPQFTIQNNTFIENQAQHLGGAIDLDFQDAQKSIVGLFYHVVYNITQAQNITVNIEYPSYISGNIFQRNIALIGGSAIHINGFNISNINNSTEYGSCPYIQNILLQDNTYIENNSPENDQYKPSDESQQPGIANSALIACQCVYGEIMMYKADNMAYYCAKCPYGSFISQNTGNRGVNEICYQCPNGFVCPGGFGALQVLPGYWSHTDLTVKGNLQANVSYRCNTSSSRSVSTCLGYEKCFNNNNNSCSYTSVCETAYTGPACSVCNEEQGYYPAGQQRCQRCDTNTKIILKMVGSIMIILVLLFISIHGTNGRIKSKLKIKILQLGFDYIIINRNQLTALLRILTSYFQNTYFFFQLQLQFPYQIVNFFSLLKSMGQPLQLFSSSFQCLLKNTNISGMTKKQLFLLEQFIWSLSLPTCIVVILCLVIVLRYLLNKRNNYLKLTIIPIYLYLYLEFLPTMYFNSLSFLSCRTIAGREYLIGDSQYQCHNDENGLISSSNLGIALPILLFELLVPITVLTVIIIYKQKNLLYRPTQISTIQYQLGYFYLGYKEECFYWEFVRIAQRILIISAFLIFYDYDSQKIFFVVLIIYGYSSLSSYIQPNDNIIVNRTEFYSNQAQIFTFIAAGLLQNITHIQVQYVCMLAVGLANITFIAYTIIKMVPEAWAQFNTLLANYKFFKKFQFVQNFIEKNKTQRIAMNNWIVVKLNIREIIDIGRDNLHIQYDEQMKQKKTQDLKKVRNRQQQIKNRNVNELNQEKVIIDEKKLLYINYTGSSKISSNSESDLQLN